MVSPNQRRSFSSIPPQHRDNFLNLIIDIGWFGVLSGSAISFISIYLARIGASAFQLGLINASPALMAVLLSLPAGWWLARQPVDKAVFRASILFRFFYLSWVIIPFIHLESLQVIWVIAFSFIMSVPGTVLAVGFNALFAEAVPTEWRGFLAGIRNAVLALTFIITSLLCGFLLERVVFPLNYQLVFLIGFLGAMLSSYHLYLVRVKTRHDYQLKQITGDLAQPGIARAGVDAVRTNVGLRALTQLRRLRPLDFSIIKTSFGPVLLAYTLFHAAQYIAIPLFPIYWVDKLHFTDQIISIGNALFYGTVFIGSTQLAKWVEKYGNHKVSSVGAILMSAYPGLTALTQGPGLFLFTSIVGGFAWSLVGGAIYNFLLERIPDDDRASHLAIYTLATNAAILFGSLVGPYIARLVGLTTALAVSAGLRFLAAITIWRLDNKPRDKKQWT